VGYSLEAAIYYSDHFQDFSRVVNMFDKNEAYLSIQITQNLIQDPNLTSDLTYIKSHFNFLPSSITLLEKILEKKINSINLMKNVENNISKIPNGNVGKAIQDKFQTVLKKNKGYETLKNMEQNYSPSDVSLFKYAPVTSVDVERSFSRYKNVLADNRRTFTSENLKKTFVVQCNTNPFGMY